MADNTLIIEVEYDGKKGFVKLNKDSIAAGESAGQDFGDSFAKTIGAVFSGNVLADAFKKLGSLAKDFASEAIKAASEAEQAQIQLSNSLKRVGGDTQQNITAFNEFAQALQRTTNVTDEQAVGLIIVANNYARSAEQAKALVRASLDLAAATGVDARSALEALGNSLNGVARGLQTLIPGFRITNEEALKAGAALQFVNQQFLGQAQANYQGTTASLSLLSKAFGEVLESSGRLITTSKEIGGFFKGLSDILFALAKAIDDAGPKIDNFVNSIRNLQAGAGPLLSILKVGVAGFDLIKNSLEDAGRVADADTLAFVQLGNAIATDHFTPYAAGANIVKTNLDLLKESLFLYGIELMNANRLTEQQAQSAFNAAIALQTAGLSIAPLSGLTAEQAVEYEKLALAMEKVGFAADSLSGKSLEALKQTQANMVQISGVMKSTLANGISQGIQSITKALIAGESGFDAFKNAILSIIGDIAINIGTTLIGIGIGIQALAVSLATLSGGVAIAAGIALVAIGTLLKSAATPGAGALAGGVAAGGGGLEGGGVGQVSNTITPAEAPKQKTEVQINVQGNILDRRESGLAIAEVLQEYFDTNDGVLAKT